MMTLNKNNVATIIGSSDTVMVYGMDSCRLNEVCVGLKALGYRVQNWEKFSFEPLDYDVTNPKILDVRTNSILCKTTITSLIAENYKRTIENQPIIPLIFCVAFEQDKRLDISRVAHSHTTGGSATIIDAELRRCYKIYAEMGPVINQIAEATFKFVKVNEEVSNHYALEQIPPFWLDPNWNQLWQERKHPQSKIEKLHPWRQVLSKAIDKFAATSRFFPPGNADVPHLEYTPNPKLTCKPQ